MYFSQNTHLVLLTLNMHLRVSANYKASTDEMEKRTLLYDSVDTARLYNNAFIALLLPYY